MTHCSLACSAYCWNWSWSMPGTVPSISISAFVIVGAPSTWRRCVFAVVSRLSGGWPCVAEEEAQRHREAAGVGGREELLGVRALAVLEAALERVVAGPGALADGDRAAAALEVAVPLRAAVPRRHAAPSRSGLCRVCQERSAPSGPARRVGRPLMARPTTIHVCSDCGHSTAALARPVPGLRGVEHAGRGARAPAAAPGARRRARRRRGAPRGRCRCRDVSPRRCRAC